MKNKQKFYFVLNLAVLLPLLLVTLARLLYTISDYFGAPSFWIEWLKDFSLWYVDVILYFVLRNAGPVELEGAGFPFLILIFQAILSLIIIVLGYFSRLLRGTAFKILLGIYVVCWLLFFISLPIQERTSDRIGGKIRNEYSLPIKTGYQKYTNEDLGYGFYYLESDSLYQCPGSPCLSIERMYLRVEALDTNFFLGNDNKNILLQDDLYCSADGPGISTSCENKSVEDYVNSMGMKGYKVLRTRTITRSGLVTPETHSDFVYIYMLPESKGSPGSVKYEAIMFAVDLPKAENLNDLNVIADTYFTL